MEFLLMGRDIRKIPPGEPDHAQGSRSRVERQIHWHPPMVRPDDAKLREPAAIFAQQKNTRGHNSLLPTLPRGSCTVVKFGMPPRKIIQGRCHHVVGAACLQDASAMASLLLNKNLDLIVPWLCARFVTNSWVSVLTARPGLGLLQQLISASTSNQ